MQTLLSIRDKIAAFLSEEGGQDTFEYLLIIGGISVAVIFLVAAAAPSLIDGVIGGVCGAINTVISPDIDCSAI